MNETRFERIVDAWIVAQDCELDSPEHDPNNWAIQLVKRWQYRHKPEQLWRFILAVLRRDISDKVLMMIACSPLEDLLADWGPEYIERVEDYAKTDKRFRHILRAVYRMGMPSEVWARLQAVVAADAASHNANEP